MREGVNTIGDRYTPPARLIHWIMAVGFGFMWICGFTMTTLVAEESSLEEWLYGSHISVGVTLLALLMIRVVVRLTTVQPPLPVSLTLAERRSSKCVHALLYVLPFAVIGAGWAEMEFGGHVVEWFGVPLPSGLPDIESVEETAEEVHKWLAYTMLALASLHVAAVAKHRWIDGHDVLHRMT